MENEHALLAEKLQAQEAKIDAIYISVEKTRKYLLVTMWVSIILFVVPLLGLLIAIPAFISMYTSSLEGLL